MFNGSIDTKTFSKDTDPDLFLCYFGSLDPVRLLTTGIYQRLIEFEKKFKYFLIFNGSIATKTSS